MLPVEMEAVFDLHGGSLIHKETRYNSTRHIDQIWSNATGTIGSARTLPFKISDHKWLSVSASLRWEREVRRCVRQRGHFWTTPPGATTSQWRDHLASTWTHYDKHVIEDSVLQALSNPNQHSVDMVWEIWNNWLQHFFGLAARTFQQPYNAETAQALNNWRRRASNSAPKPLEPTMQWIPVRHRRDAGTMAQRKRSNWLSRASRMVELMQKETLSNNQSLEMQRLCRRLRCQIPLCQARLPFKDELEAEIKAIEAQQAQDEAASKQQQISQWRHSMQHDLKARCKWLGRNSQLRPTVMHNGQQLNKDQEVLDAVAAHWQDVWKACKQEPAEPKIAFVLDYLPQHEPLHGRPSSTDFLEAWQQLGGAAGPDDWLLSELQVLPPGVAELFATVTETWEVAGCTPSALKYSRQLNLVKPHKMRDGSTKSSDLRPINVYSLWYRWWSGAWAKSKIVRVWRGRVMPAAITGGIGSPGSERLAAKLQDSFSEQGFLATLDYTLAFDHVIPEAITRGMARMGLPVQLANTLLNQWSHQKRILQWKASSSPKLLETDMSVPQGDALSPLALNILMLSGFNFTEARCPVPLGDRLHVVYMDDRSWTTKQASVLVQTLRTWHDFSRRAGLRENEAKTQITHTDAERRRELQQELADDPVLLQAVTASAVVLGCCTTGTDERDAQPKELQRLADAKLICGRIRLLPLGHQAKMDAARIMGISKAVYGWVAFSPSDSHAKVLDQALRATSEAFKDGSVHLHNVLTGAARCLRPVVGVRQVCLWCKSVAQESWSSARHRHSKLRAQAVAFLQQTGWQLQRGTWSHSQLGLSWKLSLGAQLPGRQKIAYFCREAWRHKEWGLFTASSRRDALPFRRTHYDSARIGLVRSLLCHTEGAAAAVLTGSFVSPAAFGKRPDVSAHLLDAHFALCSQRTKLMFSGRAVREERRELLVILFRRGLDGQGTSTTCKCSKQCR